MDVSQHPPRPPDHRPVRVPAEETEDYPGLFVHDGRQAGAATFQASRLPIATCAYHVSSGGWAYFEQDWDYIATDYGWTGQRWAKFLNDLFAHRGDFARLILTLADVERTEDERADDDDYTQWWERTEDRARVRSALAACMDRLAD